MNKTLKNINSDNNSVEFIKTGVNSAVAITTNEGQKYETTVFVLTSAQAKQIQVIRDQVAIELSKELNIVP